MQVVARAVLVALLTTARVGLATCNPAVEPDRTDVANARAAVAASCNCAGAASRSAYVRCAITTADAALVNKSCIHAVRACAARSTCGKPGSVTCCRTASSGRTSCSIKRSAARCVAPSGGSACLSPVASCCDACAEVGCTVTTTTTTTSTTTTTDPLAPCGLDSGGSCAGVCSWPFDLCVPDPDGGGCECVPGPCQAIGGIGSCGGTCSDPSATCSFYPGGCACFIPCDPGACGGPCPLPQVCARSEFAQTCVCGP
jgi:hypothetical protein